MTEPYLYVRFTWWRPLDLEKVGQEMDDAFELKPLYMPTEDRDIVLSQFEREELKIKADTLAVRLAPMRAVLYQREAAPFTDRDPELKKLILELYPRERSTPFSLGFQKEPRFKVA